MPEQETEPRGGRSSIDPGQRHVPAGRSPQAVPALRCARGAQGRGDQLKEYVIGVQVFDKGASFDPRADPIVRVQARRLRARLARYYREEGAENPVVLDLPKGGYAPVFKLRDAAASGRRSLGATLAGQNTIAVLHSRT